MDWMKTIAVAGLVVFAAWLAFLVFLEGVGWELTLTTGTPALDRIFYIYVPIVGLVASFVRSVGEIDSQGKSEC